MKLTRLTSYHSKHLERYNILRQRAQPLCVALRKLRNYQAVFALCTVCLSAPAYGTPGTFPFEIAQLRTQLSVALSKANAPSGATTAARSGAPGECITALQKYMAEEPRRQAPWLALLGTAACALEAQDIPLAEQAAAQGLKLRGTSSDLLLIAGIADSRLPKTAELEERARNELIEALVFDRFQFMDRIVALRVLKNTLIGNNEPNRAVAILEQWVKREPRAAPLLIHAYQRAGLKRKAFDYVDSLSTPAQQSSPEVQFYRARLLLDGTDRVLQRADFQEAAAILESLQGKVIAPDLTATDLIEMLAEAYLKLNRPQDANRILRDAAESSTIQALRQQAKDEMVAARN